MLFILLELKYFTGCPRSFITATQPSSGVSTGGMLQTMNSHLLWPSIFQSQEGMIIQFSYTPAVSVEQQAVILRGGSVVWIVLYCIMHCSDPGASTSRENDKPKQNCRDQMLTPAQPSPSSAQPSPALVQPSPAPASVAWQCIAEWNRAPCTLAMVDLVFSFAYFSQCRTQHLSEKGDFSPWNSAWDSFLFILL